MASYNPGDVISYNGSDLEIAEDLGNAVRTVSGLRIRKTKISKNQNNAVPEQWQFITPEIHRARVKPPQLPQFSDPQEFEIHPRVMEAIRECWGFDKVYRHQGESYRAIKEGSALLAFDVSAGKTLASFLYALEAALPEEEGGRFGQVIYIAPTKALANNQVDREKENSLVELIEYLGLTYTVVHSDIPTNKRDYGASIIFCNQYSFDQMLVNPKFYAPDVDVVIMDEVHSLAAGPGGGHLASIIRNLNAIRTAIDPDCDPVRYIGLSATIKHPERLFKALTEQTCSVLTKDYARVAERTVIVKYRDKKRGEEIGTALELVDNGYHGFIFIDSRARCETVCNQINDRAGAEIAGYYHSKMDPEHQEQTAHRFMKGKLKIVVTTSCLEAGIDLPGAANFVMVITNDIDPSSLRQRLGRVGRDGEPCLGYVIVGPAIYSLDAFLDRECMIVMPSFVPPIQEIHARRLAWLFSKEGVEDPCGEARKVYPHATIEEVPERNPFRSEQLFSIEKTIKVVVAKGNRKIQDVPISTAITAYLPGCVVSVYKNGSARCYEVESLDTSAGLCMVNETKKMRNYPTPSTIMHLGEHDIYSSQEAKNAPINLSSGYGSLVDTCERVTISDKGYVNECQKCRKENTGFERRCSDCGSTALNKYYRNSKPQTHKFPQVSHHFDGCFTMVATLDEDGLEFSTGAAYAVARVLSRMLNLKQDELGVSYSKKRIVFFDRHPHGAATAYLFENWDDVLKETINEVQECACNTGCSNCVEKLRGSPIPATGKRDSLDSLHAMRLIKF